MKFLTSFSSHAGQVLGVPLHFRPWCTVSGGRGALCAAAGLFFHRSPSLDSAAWATCWQEAEQGGPGEKGRLEAAKKVPPVWERTSKFTLWACGAFSIKFDIFWNWLKETYPDDKSFSPARCPTSTGRRPRCELGWKLKPPAKKPKRASWLLRGRRSLG